MAQLQRLIISSNQWVEQRIALTLEQQHYLNRVLRLRQGDRFIAMNGEGQSGLAVLLNAAEAEVIEPIDAKRELPVSVNLLLALPKAGMDEVVRQGTELGVAQILPVLSQRSLLRPSPQKLERWQRIAQEATEQSERQIVPLISPPQSWNEALQIWNSTNSICYFCEARGSYPHLLTCLQQRHLLMDQASVILPITLAIGSEGGWTETEIAAAIEAGYQPVSLGKRILRAVTAPLVALSLVASVIEAMPEPGQEI